MPAGRIAILFIMMVLAGCKSQPAIPVNDEQSLVMESSVLAAGITADKPSLTISEIQPSASSVLLNEMRRLPSITDFSGMTPVAWKCIHLKHRVA